MSPNALQAPPSDSRRLFGFSASQQVERALVACLMLKPTAFDDVAEIVKPEMLGFYEFKLIFQIVAQRSQAGKEIDPVIVAEDLQARSPKEDPDEWFDYVRELFEATLPHGEHAKYYAQEVRKHWTRRELALIGLEAAKEAGNQFLEIDDTLQAIDGKLRELQEQQIQTGPVPLTNCLVEAITELEKPDLPGIPTGLRGLDDLLGGFKPGQLIVLAARPSMGKTALAANLAQRIAERGTVVFFSLEQTRRELTERLLAGVAGCSTMDLRSLARGTTEESRRLHHAAERLSQLSLVIDDQPGRTVAEMLSIGRIQRRQGKLALIVIDYLQLLKPEDRRSVREVQVAQLSRDVKAMAKQLAVPVLCLAQLNRQAEGREDGRPRLCDIRESGAIEQDADVVLFPWRDDPKNNPHSVKLIISKNRNGPRGEVPLTWDGPTMTFSEPDPTGLADYDFEPSG